MKEAVPHVVASPDILIVAMAFPPHGNHRLTPILDERVWQCKAARPVTKT
jgi:hypothetical protein